MRPGPQVSPKGWVAPQSLFGSTKKRGGNNKKGVTTITPVNRTVLADLEEIITLLIALLHDLRRS